MTDQDNERGAYEPLRQLAEALRRQRLDAERYRWLRKEAADTLAAIAYRMSAACQFDNADEAIDAAIRQQERQSTSRSISDDTA